MLLLSKYFSAFLAALHPIFVRNARLKIFAFKAHSIWIYDFPQIPTSKAHQAEGFYLAIL